MRCVRNKSESVFLILRQVCYLKTSVLYYYKSASVSAPPDPAAVVVPVGTHAAEPEDPLRLHSSTRRQNSVLNLADEVFRKRVANTTCRPVLKETVSLVCDWFRGLTML